MEPKWVQGGYDGVFYLGEEGAPGYGGYVVRSDGDPNPETWFAYEWDHSKQEHAWVGKAPTAKEAQTAVKGEFLCEVYRNDRGAHCPFPGVVVRTTLYKGKRLRMIVCGEHASVMKGWDGVRLDEYRTQYGLIPNDPIIGDRVAPPLDLPPIRDAAQRADTVAERNVWIALNGVVRPLAELHYWRAHFAHYPLDLNKRPCADAYGHWRRAREHAEEMYACYMREWHGREGATLPNELLRLIEREAVEYLARKRG
ncbi:hypothetical protein ACWDBF_17010 [Streptomyces angustmyceticus]